MMNKEMTIIQKKQKKNNTNQHYNIYITIMSKQNKSYHI